MNLGLVLLGLIIIAVVSANRASAFAFDAATPPFSPGWYPPVEPPLKVPIPA